MNFSRYQVITPGSQYRFDIKPKYRIQALIMLILGVIGIIISNPDEWIYRISIPLVVVGSIGVILANLWSELHIDDNTISVHQGVGRLRLKDSYDKSKVRKFMVDRDVARTGSGMADRLVVYRLKLQLIGEKKPTHLLTSSLQNCYSLLEELDKFEEIACEFSLADPSIMISNTPDTIKIKQDRSQIREDQKLGVLGRFPGYVEDQGNQTVLRFDDRYRLDFLVYLFIFIVMVIIAFFIPRNAVTSLEDKQAIQIFTLGFGFFTFYQFMKTSRRTYIRVRSGIIDFGWELFGYTRTQIIAVNDIEYLTFSNKKLGHRLLMIKTAEKIYFHGHITEKKIHLIRAYIKSTIEKHLI